MTPHDIYAAALAFVDQTEELPAEVRIRMVRSYLRLLAENDPEETYTVTTEVAAA